MVLKYFLKPVTLHEAVAMKGSYLELACRRAEDKRIENVYALSVLVNNTDRGDGKTLQVLEFIEI